MKQIKTTYTALIPSALWSWILMFIPTVIDAVRIAFSKYTYNDDNIVIKTGVIKQNQVSIPLYRLDDVQCTKNILESIFKVGKITLYDKDKIVVLKYVENPDETANMLRDIMVKQKKANGLKVMDIQ